ncbi:MAG: hypothetical protein AB7F23_10555 [Phycisphaerae bacterium]
MELTTYKVTFTCNGRYHETIVTTRTSTEARELVTAQYRGATSIAVYPIK